MKYKQIKQHPTEEEILLVKDFKDHGYKAAQEHAEQILDLNIE